MHLSQIPLFKVQPALVAFSKIYQTQHEYNVLQRDFRWKWKVLNTASYELQTAVRQNMSDDRLSWCLSFCNCRYLIILDLIIMMTSVVYVMHHNGVEILYFSVMCPCWEWLHSILDKSLIFCVFVFQSVPTTRFT